MEFWDALEDSQYLDAITSTHRGPKPLCKWEVPTPEQLLEWEASVRQRDQLRRQREKERNVQKQRLRLQRKAQAAVSAKSANPTTPASPAEAETTTTAATTTTSCTINTNITDSPTPAASSPSTCTSTHGPEQQQPYHKQIITATLQEQPEKTAATIAPTTTTQVLPKQDVDQQHEQEPEMTASQNEPLEKTFPTATPQKPQEIEEPSEKTAATIAPTTTTQVLPKQDEDRQHNQEPKMKACQKEHLEKTTSTPQEPQEIEEPLEETAATITRTTTTHILPNQDVGQQQEQEPKISASQNEHLEKTTATPQGPLKITATTQPPSNLDEDQRQQSPIIKSTPDEPLDKTASTTTATSYAPPKQDEEDRVEPLTLEWYLGSPIGFFFFSSFLKEHDRRNDYNLPSRRIQYDFSSSIDRVLSGGHGDNHSPTTSAHMVITTSEGSRNDVNHRIPNSNDSPCFPSIQMNFLEDLIRFQAILRGKKGSRSKRNKLARRLLRYLDPPIKEEMPPLTPATTRPESEPQISPEKVQDEQQQQQRAIRYIYEDIPRLILIQEDDLHLHPTSTSRKKLGCFTHSQLDAAYSMNFDPQYTCNVVGLKGPILLELMQVLHQVIDAHQPSTVPTRHSSNEVPSPPPNTAAGTGILTSVILNQHNHKHFNGRKRGGSNHNSKNSSSITNDSDEHDDDDNSEHDTGVIGSVRSAPQNIRELNFGRGKIPEDGLEGAAASNTPQDLVATAVASDKPRAPLIGSDDLEESARVDDVLEGASTMRLGVGLENVHDDINDAPPSAESSGSMSAPPILERRVTSDALTSHKSTISCPKGDIQAPSKAGGADDLSGTITIQQHSIFPKAEAIIFECLKRNYDDEFQGVPCTATVVSAPEGEQPTSEEPSYQPHPFYVRMRNFLWYGDRRVVYEDFFVMRVLGRGGFGLVNACQKGTTGRLYAVKTLDKRRLKSKKSTNFVLNERQALAAVAGSPFIINLKYCFHSTDEIYLVMDLMTGGDLGFHLSLKRRFPIDQCLYYAARIMLGLQALHDKGYVYRDMKPENCLLSEDGRVKITDLGLATRYSPRLPSGLVGTRGYWAPEMHQRDKTTGKRVSYNNVVDWFSFGCCLAEFISGHNPFRTEAAVRFGMDRGEKTKDKALDLAIQEMEPDLSSSHFTPDAADVCRRLLDKNPSSRLGAHGGCKEIMSHPWFHSVRWGDVISDRQRPPFIPATDVNAASQNEIGHFADASSKTVRSLILDHDDEAKFKDWDWTNPRAYCSEVLEFVIYERDLGRPLVPEAMHGDLCCFCCNIL